MIEVRIDHPTKFYKSIIALGIMALLTLALIYNTSKMQNMANYDFSPNMDVTTVINDSGKSLTVQFNPTSSMQGDTTIANIRMLGVIHNESPFHPTLAGNDFMVLWRSDIPFPAMRKPITLAVPSLDKNDENTAPDEVFYCVTKRKDGHDDVTAIASLKRQADLPGSGTIYGGHAQIHIGKIHECL